MEQLVVDTSWILSFFWIHGLRAGGRFACAENVLCGTNSSCSTWRWRRLYNRKWTRCWCSVPTSPSTPAGHRFVSSVQTASESELDTRTYQVYVFWATFGRLVPLCRQRFTLCEFRSGSFGMPALSFTFPHFSTSELHGKNWFTDECWGYIWNVNEMYLVGTLEELCDKAWNVPNM